MADTRRTGPHHEARSNVEFSDDTDTGTVHPAAGQVALADQRLVEEGFFRKVGRGYVSADGGGVP